jgi:hypothetical protein
MVLDDAAEQDLHNREDLGPKVWLNNGDGTFQEGESYIPEPPGFVQVLVADLNGDTYPDLIARHYPNDTITVRFGAGDGTFGEPVPYEAAYGMNWLVLADLNGDAYPDLAGVGSRKVLVFINNGDGTFTDKVDYDVGGSPENIVAVDMDGDASLDLLVGPTASGMASVLTNNGDGTFELTKDFSFERASPDLFTASDVDGDGQPELVGWDETTVYVLPLSDSE